MVKEYIFGRYEVGKNISNTGMSSVFEGYDHKMKRDVIIKVLEFDKKNSDKDSIQRFISEASLLQDISHPSIVDVYDCGRDSNRLYYVMEHIKGVPLSDFLTIPLNEIISVFVDMAEVLCFLHFKGIVHRDIKPENIIICTENGTNKDTMLPKLIDFGLARSSEEGRITSKGFIMGSMNYIAPEQLMTGEVDVRSDMYSFGVTMYQSLTGRFPFQSDNMESSAYLMLQSTPEPPSTYNDKIPQEIDDLLLLLLRQEPSERMQTSQELYDELKSISKNMQNLHPPKGFVVRIPDFFGRDWELQEIKNWYENNSKENILVITGLFGIGKTRLLDEFSSRLIVNSQLQVRARGNSMTRFHEYSGLKQIAFDIAHFDSKVLKKIEKCKEEFAKLGSLHPKLMARLSTEKKAKSDGNLDIAKLFSQLLNRFDEKICVIVDDAHMLDDKTIEACVACAKENSNVFLILSFEKNVNKYLEALTQKNTRIINYINLDNLDKNSSTNIVQSCLKSKELPTEIIDDAFCISQGIPLLIMDFVRSAVESNSINRVGDKFSYKEGIPQKLKTIDDITKRCISGLTDDSKKILKFMVVYDKPVSIAILTKVFKIKKANSMQIIDELVRAGIVDKQKNDYEIPMYHINHNYDKNYIRRTVTKEEFGLYSRESAHIHMTLNIEDIDFIELSRHLINSGEVLKAVYILCHYIIKSVALEGQVFSDVYEIINEFADDITYSNWQTLKDVLDLSKSIKIFKASKEKHRSDIFSIRGHKTKIEQRILDHIMILVHLDSNHYRQARVILDAVRDNHDNDSAAILRLIEESALTDYARKNYMLEEVERSLSIQGTISNSQSGINRVSIDTDRIWLWARKLEFEKIEKILKVNQDASFLLLYEKYMNRYNASRFYLEIISGKFHMITSLQSKLSEGGYVDRLEMLFVRMQILSCFFGGDWSRINEFCINLSDSSLDINDFSDVLVFPYAVEMLRGWRFDCPFSVDRITQAVKHSASPYKSVMRSIVSLFTKNQDDTNLNESIESIWDIANNSNSNELILEFCFWMSLLEWRGCDIQTLKKIRNRLKNINIDNSYSLHVHLQLFSKLSLKNAMLELDKDVSSITGIQYAINALPGVKVISPILWALESFEIAKLFWQAYRSVAEIEPDSREIISEMLDNAEFVWSIVDASRALERVHALKANITNSDNQ